MKYEYKTIEKYTTKLNDLLNELGEEGWDLCGIYHDVFIFKKPILTIHTNSPYNTTIFDSYGTGNPSFFGTGNPSFLSGTITTSGGNISTSYIDGSNKE